MSTKRQRFFDPRHYQIRAGVPAEYPHGAIVEPHRHPWHQLTFASQGVVTVTTREGSWVVPEMSGPVSLRALYVAPTLSTSLPAKCCVVEISPLMRELILRVSELKGLNSHIPLHSHLVPVMLDHLQLMQSDPIHLPLPRDGRAKRIVSLLRQEPANRRPLGELAKTAGASKRTLERLFKSETGLGFGKWRQQFRLGHALRLLAAGQAVTSVALDVGYESPSAFISAFRVTFGQTPGEYFRSA